MSSIYKTLILVILVALMLLLRMRIDPSKATLYLRSDYWSTTHEKTPLGIVATITGFRVVAADLLWLELIQYYGDLRMSHEGYRKFYPKLKIVTALDPHFIHAYTYGSAILAWNMNLIPEAISLMEEGIVNNPGTEAAARLSLYLAGITYQQLGDTKNLISILEQIVKQPFHPAILERMLGFIYERQGRWKTARNYWAWVIETTNDDGVRSVAIQHFKKLENK